MQMKVYRQRRAGARRSKVHPRIGPHQRALTMGIGNEMMGTVYSDVLWSLALLLLAMSFVFISIIHFIERREGLNANGR